MRRSILWLMAYLIIFGVLFIVSLHNFIIRESFFEIGLPGQSLDILIMIMSFLGILKTLWHMRK